MRPTLASTSRKPESHQGPQVAAGISLAAVSCVYSGHTSHYQKTWNLNGFLLLELSYPDPSGLGLQNMSP